MELLVLALLRAGTYVLIAVGFALVFGSLRILNLMHGSFVMLGAYGSHFFIAALAQGQAEGTPPGVATGGVLLAALATSLVGWAFFKALQATGRTGPREVLGIAVAGNLFIAQILQYLYGTEGLNVTPILRGSRMLAGVPVPANDLLILPAALAAVLGLWLWLGFTRSGRALRAVADDSQAAKLAGISADRALAGAVGIAALLAGLAGGLTAPNQTLSPGMWVHPLLVSFAVVVFGGRGSTWGAVGSASFLGIAEVVTSWCWSEAASQYVALLVIVAGLVVLPKGLAGGALHDVR
ncbi:MAG TPA: branched-chain amino acid ABC transporter permease [Thermoanaerobaculia bacterium]|nr:branched-chain amino acid ABC transporter permease [Thermoanaerobaculia bacterium]